jgi:hypothetical protein
MRLREKSDEEIKKICLLNDNQVQKFIDVTTYILLQKELYDRIKNMPEHVGVIMNIRNGLDYNIYKVAKAKHISLWTGLISRAAFIEYVEAESENRKPVVTAEHFHNRKKVILDLLDGDGCDALIKYGWKAMAEIYFENPGIGQFHITTKSENHNLIKYQVDITLPWEKQYEQAGIELFPAYQGPNGGNFKNTGQSWWLHPEMEMIHELTEEYEILIYEEA